MYPISFCIFFLPQNHQSFQRLWWQWLNLTRQHLARNVLPWNLTQIKSPKKWKIKIYKTVHLSKHVYLATLKFPESGSSLKIQQPEIGVSSPHRLHLHGLHRTLPTPDLKWVRMVNYIWIFQHFKPGFSHCSTTYLDITRNWITRPLSNKTCQAGSSRRSLATVICLGLSRYFCGVKPAIFLPQRAGCPLSLAHDSLRLIYYMIYFKFLLNHRMSTPLIPKQSKDNASGFYCHIVGFPSVWKNIGSFSIGNRPILELPWCLPTCPPDCTWRRLGPSCRCPSRDLRRRKCWRLIHLIPSFIWTLANGSCWPSWFLRSKQSQI